MKFCILVLFCCHFSGGGKCTLYRRAIRTSGILPVKSFSQPHVLISGMPKVCKKVVCLF